MIHNGAENLPFTPEWVALYKDLENGVIDSHEFMITALAMGLKAPTIYNMRCEYKYATQEEREFLERKWK